MIVNENIVKNTAAKYKFIFDHGYLPNRGTTLYTQSTAKKTNCYGHAIPNLSNSLLDKLSNYEQEMFFYDFLSREISLDNFEPGLIKTASLLGLNVKPCNKDDLPDMRSWKIAVYTCENDIHFLLQNELDFYTHKQGWNDNITILSELPNQIKVNYLYNFQGTFMVSNPNGKFLNKDQLKQLEIDLQKL